MKLIHIGLGKTGTTFLQKHVFNIISKHENLIYFDSNHPGFNKVRDHSIKLRTGEKIEFLNLPDNIFSSDETLISWNPNDWETFANKNLIAFGHNTVIILTLREPTNYFNSLYNEICIQSSKVKSFDDFIYSGKKKNNNDSTNLNIDLFSYSRIINLYRKRFNKVIVIKYEDIKNLQFISKHFNNYKKIIKETKHIKKKEINKSYSKYIQNLHFFLFYTLSNIIYILIKISFFKKFIKYIAKKMVIFHFPYQLQERTLNKLNNINNEFLSKKVTEYIFVYLKIKFFLQKIDIFFPDKKILREFKGDVKKKINELAEEYKGIL